MNATPTETTERPDVAECYFTRPLTSREMEAAYASMEREEFNEWVDACGKALAMGPIED